MSETADFLDTNVLVYLLSKDATKADRAEALLRDNPVISVQVLNEFVSVARRKAKLPWPDIRESLGIIRALCAVRPLTVATHDLALDIAERFGFAIYDSLIVAAAAEAGCRRLWSEDMQHGQIIDGVAIANPFRT